MRENLVYVVFDDPKLMMTGSAIAKSMGSGCLPPYSNNLDDVSGTLIIVAHGMPHSDYLYEKQTTPCKTVSAKQLAKDLVDQGLGKSCTRIELLACGAGTAEHFPALLKNELLKRGLRIEVEGWSTSVGVTGAGHVGVGVPMTGTGRRARVVRSPRG